MTPKRDYDQPLVLTIAGFDPSGGAGIIVDVQTLLSFGCRPIAAITSLTFQNSEAVFGALHETAESVRAQILPVAQVSNISAVKIGMMPTAEIVSGVARLIRELNLPPPVLDPVLRSTSGYDLIEADAFESLRRELFPLARLITPNIPEAESLTGVKIEDVQDMRETARRLREKGARAVLIKGGHLGPLEGGGGPQPEKYSAETLDVLDDDGEVTVFRDEWINARPLRGTGCMLSSAIACGLGNDLPLVEAVHEARLYVRSKLQGQEWSED